MIRLGKRQREVLRRLREQDPCRPEQFGPRYGKAVRGLLQIGAIVWLANSRIGRPRYVALWESYR